MPTFASPEPAARALARAANYAAWRARPPGVVPELEGFDANRANAVVDAVLARLPMGGWLRSEEVGALLAAAGVASVAGAAVVDADDAARVASRLGFPVALKVAGAEVVHKSDIGGVRLGLRSAP